MPPLSLVRLAPARSAWRAAFVVSVAALAGACAPSAPLSDTYDPACEAAGAAAFATCAERHVKRILVEYDFPSFSVGVVRRDSLVYAGSFGVADRETGAAATSQTLYQIGSVTKMFTGLLCALMVEDGTVSLDDRLASYLPADARVPTDGQGGEILLRHLATHTSGLPRFPPNLDRADGDPILGFSQAELYEGLAASELAFAVGEEREYSNFGYGVLAHALERAAAEPYEALLRRYILDPLQMNGTRLTLGPEQRSLLATPYRDDDPTVRTEPWDMGAMSGAGGLFTSVADLARFVAFQTAPSPNALGPHTAGALRLMRTPFYKSPDQAGVAYGLGCFVVDWTQRDATLVLHNGDIDGYAAHVRFSPDLHTGVIVLTNSGMGKHVGPLANELMKAALDAFGAFSPAEVEGTSG